MSFFATALVSEGPEGDTSHSLSTFPMAQLSHGCQQPFRICSGGHHKQTKITLNENIGGSKESN